MQEICTYGSERGMVSVMAMPTLLLAVTISNKLLGNFMLRLSIITNLIFLLGKFSLFLLAVSIILGEKSVAIIIPASGIRDRTFSPPPVPKSNSNEFLLEYFSISL